MAEPRIVIPDVAGSNPVGHPPSLFGRRHLKLLEKISFFRDRFLQIRRCIKSPVTGPTNLSPFVTFPAKLPRSIANARGLSCFENLRCVEPSASGARVKTVDDLRRQPGGLGGAFVPHQTMS